ncbi:signal peptidase II [Jeotgalicoccus aerolatus]|uniref:Lipoprotein signal peptidase n=1 Tax=Jeotgalicoccus aerolatus TaxID=709510 RepID=A0ABS4HKT0_9STAP|nr:signal peptidase II [Jeotgalicoccus aerolatus]MBP1951418.1 signal peptidase II [Jeotgalicoccus aerolatus]GGD97661.1 lipoprotein signal peptidase [Jeotgalicoccus aerolatus]HJG33605.1 signal peptidase II [Jeotgalicoccus aerolatus]
MKQYRILPMAIVGIIVLAIDQLTKFLVATQMSLGESIPVIGEYLKITSHRNSGAAWGMFEGRMLFFYIITVAVLVFLIYFYKTEAKNNLLMQVGITLLMAGALGNFIDRLLFQEVVDFVDVLIINYDFPIFNVADSALTVGVIILLIEVFITGRGKNKK